MRIERASLLPPTLYLFSVPPRDDPAAPSPRFESRRFQKLRRRCQSEPAAVADAKLLLLVQKIDVKYAPLRSVVPAELPESLRAAIPVQRVTMLRNGLRYRPLARRSRIRGRKRHQDQNDWTQDELSELHRFPPTLSRMAMLPPRVGRRERQNPPSRAQRGRVAAYRCPC